MEGTAFCPAHVTGFFGIETADAPEQTGSVGAGFSIRMGVTTSVRVMGGGGIKVAGGVWGGITEYVAGLFCDAAGVAGNVEILHDSAVPAGYGLGSSGAAALSTLYALDRAFGTGMDRVALGQMAHRAELHHRSGLGDVLAAYHGGFEVRTRAGAPGYGRLVQLDVGDPDIVIACLAPLSTGAFLKREIAGGYGMVEAMLEERSASLFQELSLRFARENGVATAAVEDVVRRIGGAGAGCGVAMVGETVFCMAPAGDGDRIAAALRPYRVYRTRIDTRGARTIQ